MAPGKKSYKCGICALNVSNNHDSIMCDVCSSWIHADCAGLSKEDVNKLDELECTSFICSPCKKRISSNNKNNINGSLKDEITNLNSKVDAKFDDLNAKFDKLMSKCEDDRNFIKKAFDDAVSDFKKEMSTCVNALKDDIRECNTLIKNVESKTDDRMSNLETENNLLYMKFNRPDLIINGLPDCLKNVRNTIIDLASFYEISISPQDINLAFYTNNKKSVLVKFNSVFLRDEIMREYFKSIKTQPLKASDFITEPKIPVKLLDRRIFLNEHYSPAAGKLNAICLKLRHSKLVNKFKIINAVKPIAVLTLPDNKVVERDYNGCAELLKTIGEVVL